MRYLFTLLFFSFFAKIYAQQPEFFAPHGGIFTPKGDLRVLLVFVTFKDKPSSNPNFSNLSQNQKGWPVYAHSTYRLPQSVDTITGDCREFMFSQPQHFETLMDSVSYNYSKEFYLMSKGQFRLMGEVFSDSLGRPASIEIDPDGCGWWSQCNRKAWEVMQQLNPRFNWSRFDQRKNMPNFKFDNSRSQPDKILDYVVFIYRYQLDWAQPPVWGMQQWAGAGGGVATTGLGVDQNTGGFTPREGFTMCYNGGVFIHEVAHTLYNMPHIFGTNKVLGDYFYLPSVGWGATSMVAIFRGGLTAWERWYLGYIDWVADIPAQSAQKEYVFELGDYLTTGDAARIALPHTEQFLYLENHRGQHIFDRHIWQGNPIGKDTIGQTPTGLYIYAAGLPSDRSQAVQALSNKANSVRLLNANGNFDYQLADSQQYKNAWGNDAYIWKQAQPNPTGGLNPYIFYPLDKNKDGQLTLNPNYNQGSFEGAMLLRQRLDDGQTIEYNGGLGTWRPEFADFYRCPSFQIGDSLSLSTNPLPLNHPAYNLKNQELEPFVLNGLSIKIEPASQADKLRIRVQLAQYQLAQSTQWTGRLLLPNLSQDQRADLQILRRRQLRLRRTATPNRHTKSPEGDFCNPTTLTVQAGATLQLDSRARLYLDDDSQLIIEKGAALQLHRRAKIIQSPKSKIIYK